jgi:hypothetical protein
MPKRQTNLCDWLRDFSQRKVKNLRLEAAFTGSQDGCRYVVAVRLQRASYGGILPPVWTPIHKRASYTVEKRARPSGAARPKLQKIAEFHGTLISPFGFFQLLFDLGKPRFSIGIWAFFGH